MREDGEIRVIDPEKDRPLDIIPTLQCKHCGKHFPIRPGSGKVRGYCFRCAGPVCGRKCHGTCVPAERQIENLEQGRDIRTPPPVQVTVCKPKLILPGHVRR